MNPKRFWYYSPLSYRPRWWNMLGVPHLGEDEYGRRTLVEGSFLTGYLVWAFKTCQCEDCVDIRYETQLDEQYEVLKEKYGQELADEVRLRELQKRRA